MSRLGNQRGGAMIVVTMTGLVITMAFALFVSSFVVAESRAVEGELLRTRAYWAQMGNFAYALSRISKSKLCGSCLASTNNKDSDLALVMQAYFNELGNNKTWTYADESASYYITTTVTAAADNTAGRQNYSGWLMATSAYTQSSVASAISSHLPLMELRVCVGLNNSGAKCGGITNNNGGNATAYFSISRLTNLPG